MRVVSCKRARREARQVMRLLFRQIRSVRRHRDQGPQQGPEGIELAPPENRVDRLDPIDELLACVLGHMLFIVDPELSLCGSRGILMNEEAAPREPGLRLRNFLPGIDEGLLDNDCGSRTIRM